MHDAGAPRFEGDVTLALAHAHGPPPLRGRLKVRPEDFRVEELPALAPDGEGEHLLIEVVRAGLDTFEVARRLARALDLPPRAIGFAGLKDRHAVATQWFSLHLPGARAEHAPPRVEGLSIRVLGRHRRKLRRGELAGNRFAIVLRDIEGDRAGADARLRRLASAGLPNYFGPQRFGNGASNLNAAAALFSGRTRRLPPERMRMVCSAARSHLFNRVLDARVRDGSWRHPLEGEVLLEARGGRAERHLPGEPGQARRLEALALHPSGPLPGRPGHCLPPLGAAAAREARVLGRSPWGAWVDWLARHGFDALRRPLRVRPEALDWHWPRDDALALRFELPPGSYATAVVRELMRPRAHGAVSVRETDC